MPKKNRGKGGKKAQTEETAGATGDNKATSKLSAKMAKLLADVTDDTEEDPGVEEMEDTKPTAKDSKKGNNKRYV